ncbi:MAG: hypothetical protein WCK35_01255 [Chloroflexota bacterium]
MSNYGLKSQVASLERELSQAQSINNRLKSELSTITNGVNSAQSELDNYNTHVQTTLENSNGKMVSSHSTIISAYELQGDIERLYRNFKNIELANKKIRIANNKKYYEFSTYRTVRKIVQGMMDNIDLNMVSNKTINKSIEIQHLQSPDYWLTCVLISIMAWKGDSKELAEKAITRAISLDKKNSAVFYMLFNIRMGREEAALRWFSVYQSCDLRGSDQRTFLMLFSLLNKTISENVDAQTVNEINKFIKRVIQNNMESEGYHENDIINSICSSLERMKPKDQLPYPFLNKYCAEFGQLENQMMLAKNNITILEFILKTINVPAEQKNAFLKEFIDELIALPNQSEKLVYEEILYNELIIKLEGDVETAKQKYDSDTASKENELKLIEEMIRWIFEHDSLEINSQIRKNVFVLTREFQEKALSQYVQNYRGLQKNNYPINIGNYASVADLKNENNEQVKITNYFKQEKDVVLSAVKDGKAYISFGAALLFFIGAFFTSNYLFGLTAIGLVVGALILFSNKNKRNAIELDFNEKTHFTIDVLRKIFAEFKLFQVQFSEYDKYYDQIVNEINKV